MRQIRCRPFESRRLPYSETDPDARYYEPTSGRFLSADPMGQAISPSLYDFAGGDPVNFFDPTGRCPGPSNSKQPFNLDPLAPIPNPFRLDPIVGGENPVDPNPVSPTTTTPVVQSSVSLGTFVATQLRPGDLFVYSDNNIVQTAIGALTPGSADAGHVAVALNGGTVLTARPGDGVVIDNTPYGGGSGANITIYRPTTPVDTTGLIQYATAAVGSNPGYSYVVGPVEATVGISSTSSPICSTVVANAERSGGVAVPSSATTPNNLAALPNFTKVWP